MSGENPSTIDQNKTAIWEESKIITVFKLENLPQAHQEAIKEYFKDKKELIRAAIEWASMSKRAKLLSEVLNTTIKTSGINNANTVINSIVEGLTKDTQEMLDTIKNKIKDLPEDTKKEFLRKLENLQTLFENDLGKAHAEAKNLNDALDASKTSSTVQTPPSAPVPTTMQTSVEETSKSVLTATPANDQQSNGQQQSSISKPIPTATPGNLLPNATVQQTQIAQNTETTAQTRISTVPTQTPVQGQEQNLPQQLLPSNQPSVLSSTPGQEAAVKQQTASQNPAKQAGQQNPSEQVEQPEQPGSAPKELSVEEQANLFAHNPDKFFEYQLSQLAKDSLFWGIIVGVVGKEKIGKLLNSFVGFFKDKIESATNPKNEISSDSAPSKEQSEIKYTSAKNPSTDSPTSLEILQKQKDQSQLDDLQKRLDSPEMKKEIAKERQKKLDKLPPALHEVGEIFATMDAALFENKSGEISKNLSTADNKLLFQFLHLDDSKVQQLSQGIVYFAHEGIMEILDDPDKLAKALDQFYASFYISVEDNSEDTKKQKESALQLLHYQSIKIKYSIGQATAEDITNAQKDLHQKLAELEEADPVRGKIQTSTTA